MAKVKQTAKKSSTPKSKKAPLKRKAVVKKAVKALKKPIKKPYAKTTKIIIKKAPLKKSPAVKTPSKKTEDYMDAKQREYFKKMLLSWKRQLLHEMERTVHHMQDEAANFPDPNDRATQEEEFSLELRARDRERKLIKKIDESLLSLDKNDYGYCEGCGMEIGAKRLEARPTATLCIDCKTVDEIREKHYN